MKMLRYGCVGAGAIARAKHMKGYSAFADIEFVSVCDTNEKFAQEAAQEFGFKKYYTDYREMLEKEKLDFISVCTPNYLHFPVTLLALENGLHVHCEKPVALNSIEAQKMVDARNKYGKILMIALNNRFTNHAWFVKKYTEEGLLGEIYHARCGWKRQRGIPGKGGWFTNKALSGGGPLIDLGVHFMDLAMYFMGYPKPVSVVGATYSKFARNECVNSSGWGMTSDKNGIMDVEDMAVGFIRLENNTTIDIEFSWASNIDQEDNYYELLGTKGGAIYRGGELRIITEQFSTIVEIKPNLNFKCPVNEFSHFIDCVKNGTEPLSKPEEAVVLMKIIDGIYKSSQTKQEVVL
ncbi:MAG: Gfo/Idh/MocA family oxidoreductase [Clostridiaceae bacterium]|nr:Gfo/Idh/MocA family oxidoreductase [Clostridiaceae bacterium]